jgi:2-hydroxy-3-keto-5-methylthiopentenyl-1-phosphate phosphatase
MAELRPHPGYMKFTIDPTFYDFVSFCQSIDVEMRVVSCSIVLVYSTSFGALLNWNICQFIQLCWTGMIKDLKCVFLIVYDRCKVSEGRFSVCKGSLIRLWQAKRWTVSIVGDGESDFCGAAQANHVFARDLL